MQPQAYGTPLDYGIIIAYLVFIFGFGLVLARFNKSTRDFFLGGQRFGWGVIALSLVATTVGSYSFVKYTAMSYKYGLAGSMAYLNDWFWMPLFMFVWLPIIYYVRVNSVPEYFERRFDRRARAMATVIILLYTVGYIGINLLTMGKVAAQLLGYEQGLGPVFISATIIAIISAIYVSSGGQAAVILSDVLQGVLLLAAGLWLFALGIDHIGGFHILWDSMTATQRLPLSPLNSPPSFNFIGVFWQDAVTQGIVVYFLNQGHMQRFLSGRDVDTGRKSVIALLLFLQVVAVIAVTNAGWIGRAMVENGMIEASSKPDEIFMVVSHILCQPGVFGFILAALTAAMMSTADTLINAAASIWVNDVWRLYVRPDASDAHHLKVGRIASMGAAGIGIAMVPIYYNIGTIYQAHGAFTAAIGPPMAVTIMLGMLWKRFTPAAAFWTMLGGLLIIVLSFPFPEMITPLSMGVGMDPNPWKTYSFQRALFGLVASGIIGVTVTMFTKPRSAESLVGLVMGTLRQARNTYKGKEDAREGAGPKVRVKLHIHPEAQMQTLHINGVSHFERHIVFASASLLKRMDAIAGDVIIFNDPRIIMADLKGGQARVEETPAEWNIGDEFLSISGEALSDSQVDKDRDVIVRRVL
ncbi:sodium/solute symporter [Myxococcota bacterium]|nr:sodium/solute symporter [Myxococcota bacterium]